jgi:hypothetical protein
MGDTRLREHGTAGRGTGIDPSGLEFMALGSPDDAGSLPPLLWQLYNVDLLGETEQLEPPDPGISIASWIEVCREL